MRNRVRGRKGLALVTSTALAAGALVGAVFASPAQAAGNPVTLTTPVGLRAAYDSGASYTYSLEAMQTSVWSCGGSNGWYDNTGVFIMGDFTGAAAASMWVTNVEVRDVPADATATDEMQSSDLAFADTYNGDSEYSGSWGCSSELEQGATTNNGFVIRAEGDSAWWDTPGDYTYRVYFDGTTVSPFFEDVVIHVSGAPTKVTVSGGEANWPAAQGGFSAEDEFTVTYLDASGDITSLTNRFWNGNDVGNYDGTSAATYEDLSIWDDNSGDFIDYADGDYSYIDGTYVGGASKDQAGTFKFDFKTTIDASYTDTPSADDYDFDSSPVSVNFHKWVGVNDVCTKGLVKSATLATATYPVTDCKSGVEYSWRAYLRTDGKTITMTYDGGSAEANKYVGFYETGWDATLTDSIAGDDNFALTNASGHASITFTLSVSTEGDDGQVRTYSYGTGTDENVYEDHGFTVYVEKAGYLPTYRFQGTNWGSYVGDNSNAWSYNNYDYFDKSFLNGSTVNLTFKATDVWGAPYANKLSYLDNGCCGSASFDTWDDSETTDANGNVTFTLTNDDAASNTGTDVYYMYAYPYSGSYGYDYVSLHFVRSLAVHDLNFDAYEYGYDDLAAGSDMTIDPFGFDYTNEYVEASYSIENNDGTTLYGVPVTATTTAGGYVYPGDDDDWDDIVGYGDVSGMQSGPLTFPSNGMGYITYVGTKTGANTFGMTAGGLTDSADVNYVNDASMATSIVAVPSTVAVRAGQVAPVIFKVQDRFGNGVEGIDVNLLKTAGVGVLTVSTLVSDANGLVSGDLTTPAGMNASQVISASIASTQDNVTVSTQLSDVLCNTTDYPTADWAKTWFSGDRPFAEFVPTPVCSAKQTVSSTVAMPTVKVTAGSKKAWVWVRNLVAGDTVRIWADGKSKATFVAGGYASLTKLKLKKGKHKIKVQVTTQNGVVTKTIKVKVKK